MRKLRLDVMELRVESFDAHSLAGARKGTVRGQESDESEQESCWGTCPWQWTCWGSVAPMECCA